MTLLAFALALSVGLSLGLLGGGGSILTVPILVYVVGFAPKEAIATSLVVVGASSLLGAFGHWRAGNVNLSIAAIFGAVAMCGTFLGSRLAAYVSGTTQLVLFALVMLAAAVFMLRGSRQSALTPSNREDRFRPTPRMLGPIVIAGLATGALTGLVGVGGGFLIVPALVLLLALPMKQAVGTSLLVIAMNSAIGFLGYADQVAINWQIAGACAAAAGLGIVAGSALTRAVSAQSLRGGFAVFLIGMAIFVLYQNRFALLPA
jgi:uncharacterized membrane protein YfcA